MAAIGTMDAPDIAAAEVSMARDEKSKEKPMEASKETAVQPTAAAADIDSTTETDDEIPSEEDLETLRRVPGRVPWICFTVAFVELCERFAYYGTTAVREYMAEQQS